MTRESRLTSLDPSRWPQRIGSAPIAGPTVAQQSAGTVMYVCTTLFRRTSPQRSRGDSHDRHHLARYLSMRFFNTIMMVFVTICGTVYVVDFVEMLRRASNHPGVTPLFVAFLSFLRTPSVAEQVLPFCVLFGTMTAFIDLTRRLELIVARAAGVSVWQFLLPPVASRSSSASPRSTAESRLGADEAAGRRHRGRIFGRNGQSEGDTSLWIRQTSVDGQAFLQGDESSDGGAKLFGVNGYLYDPNGHFDLKVKAKEGQLTAGRLATEKCPADDARPRSHARRHLPDRQQCRAGTSCRDLPVRRVRALLGPAEAAPETDAAGLDSTGFSLQYQTLLARPLLLVAMVLIAAAFSLRFFRFGRHRQDGRRWLGGRFRAVSADENGRRSRFVGSFERLRRGLVARDRRQHARGLGSLAAGGRVMARRPSPSDRCLCALRVSRPRRAASRTRAPLARLLADRLFRAGLCLSVARLGTPCRGRLPSRSSKPPRRRTRAGRRPDTAPEDVHPGG